jgi:hypothetical protein
MQNLHVHWFFTKDSTTRNTSSITNEVIMVSNTKRNLEINDYDFSYKRQNFSHNKHMQL